MNAINNTFTRTIRFIIFDNELSTFILYYLVVMFVYGLNTDDGSDISPVLSMNWTRACAKLFIHNARIYEYACIE